jgi:hypothetical protein
VNGVTTGPLLKRATAAEPVIVGDEDEEVVDMSVCTQKPCGVKGSAVSEKDEGAAVQ